MHIAIDARLADTVGGIGRYTRDLVASLGKYGKKHQYSALTYHHQDTSWTPNSIKLIKFNKNHKAILPFIWEHFLLPLNLNNHHFDLIHFPQVNVPLGYNKPHIATIHDLSIYDHPEWFPSGQFLSTKLIVPQSIKKAPAIFAISEDIKQLTIKKFNINPNKISVIPNGIDLTRFKPPSKPTRDYLLFVGNAAPYKNVQLLNKIAQQTDIKIVVVGPAKQDFTISLSGESVSPNIEFIGQLDYTDPLLIKLYQNALCLLQTSLYDSFALPILESLACGTPAIASDIPSLKNIYKNHIPYASLQNPDQWISLIKNTQKNKHHHITAKNKNFLHQFSWQNLISQLEQLYTKTTKS